MRFQNGLTISSSDACFAVEPIVERPDLDALFADLAHPNPHLLRPRPIWPTVDHWPKRVDATPDLELLDQPDVSLRRAAVRGLEPLVRQHCNPWRSCLKSARTARCAPGCVKAYAQIASNRCPGDLLSLSAALDSHCCVSVQGPDASIALLWTGVPKRGVEVGGDGPWPGG